jgi:hypothetical protein
MDDYLMQLIAREKELKHEISKRKERIKQAPGGNLRIAKKGKYFQYYKGNIGEKNGKYIPKSEEALILSLAQKRYDKTFIELGEEELVLISNFLKNYTNKTREVLSLFPDELKNRLDYVDLPDEDFVRQWQRTKYPKKAIGDDVPMHITTRGERVRSKSEEMIANALFKKGIPYRYEFPVLLYDGSYRHPDFMVLDVRTRKETFWEHLGMLDKPEYVDRNLRKFRDYESSGICLGRDMLVTYESSKMPLNSKIIDDFIRIHFGV